MVGEGAAFGGSVVAVGTQVYLGPTATVLQIFVGIKGMCIAKLPPYNRVSQRKVLPGQSEYSQHTRGDVLCVNALCRYLLAILWKVLWS
jgi:hypothetical protein